MDFDALEQGYQAARQTGYGQPQTAPMGGFKPPQKKKRNFFLDQISTAGGILGGIGGTLVAPVVGTAAGGAAGAGIGELIENMIDPESGDNGNILEEALLGGAFAAGPIKLAKAGFGGVRGLSAGAKAAQAGTQAASSAGQQALKTSARGQIKSLGNKTLASQYGTISKPVARATNPMQTIDELANIGIVKPQDAERISRAITGSNGILNQQVSKAVGDAGIVPTGNLSKVLKEAITDNGLVDSQAKSVTQTVKAQLARLQKNGSRPNEVLKIMKNLEKRAATLQGKGSNYALATPERVDQANVLLRVRDELQEQLYKTAGANKNLSSVLTPDLRNQLISLQPKNKQWANYVDNNIMKATDVGAIRSAQKPFVNISKIIDEGEINSMTFGGRVGNNFRGGNSIPSRLLDSGAEVAKKQVAGPVGQTLRNFGQGATASASRVATPTAKGIAGRVGIGAPIANNLLFGGEQADAASLEEMLMSADPQQGAQGEVFPNETPGLPNGISGPLDPTNGQPVAPQQASPYPRENLLADIQRDPSNAQKYIEYYQMIDEIFGPASKQGMELSNTAIASISDTQAGLQQLENLQNTFAESSANNPLVGRLRGMIPWDTEAQSFDSELRLTRQIIGKALEGGVLRKEDEAKYTAILPNQGDTDATAKTKLERIRSDIQNKLNTYIQNQQLYSGAPQTLEDVYSQQPQQQQGAYY